MPEILISLAILAEIATFTIPKVLHAQQNQKYNAIVKEASATVSEAFQRHQVAGLVSTSTSIDDITQYMNYVSATSDSSWSIDSTMTGPTVVCDSSHPCLKLHNGATIYSGAGLFNGTETTRALSFLVDPDGKVTDGTTNGPGKSVQFFLYYNGRLTSRGQAATGTVYNGTTFSPNPNMDPPWFSW